ncbi:MAG: hypothetical protein ETSY1_31280 [Candidatus Entotheonella factor]|uniref:Uncharacterized protein n=1 Tax=Entotheonella factor TaxID=1429438 RepID=W4LC68_ENTF1|nr:MAG: hypothetical protein ETSY1_31280 [Candidatus Entotheonella factor]
MLIGIPQTKLSLELAAMMSETLGASMDAMLVKM